MVSMFMVLFYFVVRSIINIIFTNLIFKYGFGFFDNNPPELTKEDLLFKQYKLYIECKKQKQNMMKS
jgi:hypothetical protein